MNKTTYAFPSDINLGPSVNDAEWTANGGMELRDYFAAKAMTKLLSPEDSSNSYHWVAQLSYGMADAMMEARNK